MDFYTQNKFVEKPNFNLFFIIFMCLPQKIHVQNKQISYDRKLSVLNGQGDKIHHDNKKPLSYSI